MRRRHWFAAVALLAAGCSSSSGTRTKKKSRKSGSLTGRQRMNSGPQGFSNMLLPSYIEDLKSGSTDKKITAARELGNMGPGAKSALPALEKLAADKNPQVRAAAKSATASIKSR